MMIASVAPDVAPVQIHHGDSGQRVDLAGAGGHGGRKHYGNYKPYQSNWQIARHKRKKDVIGIAKSLLAARGFHKLRRLAADLIYSPLRLAIFGNAAALASRIACVARLEQGEGSAA